MARFSLAALLSSTLLACGGTAAAPAPEKIAAPAPTAQAVRPMVPSSSGEQKRLMFGTTSATSSAYTYGVAAAKVINAAVNDVSVTAVESGASVENINRMAEGTFHLGFATTDTAYRAINGIEPWSAGKSVKDLRVLWVYNVNAETYIVREDSGVQKLEDLQGKDYNPGMRGSATESMARKVLETLGITPKYYVGGTDDAVQAIKDRRIVGFTKASSAASVDAALLDLTTTTPMRVLSFSQAQVDQVVAKYPYFSSTRIPAGVYKAAWNAEPILTMATIPQVAARAGTLTDEQAYRITKAVTEDNKPAGAGVQAGGYPPMKGRDLALQTLENALTPLHAGTQKYFAELGLTIPEKLKSPEFR
ncbi:MAG: TAXI family TRAP transporter solute-binding subunit [Chloroflexi bacterium]|nr:TAXI family TRAP transporter solute-binding subunit [Chloroflexota bacterium]